MSFQGNIEYNLTTDLPSTLTGYQRLFQSKHNKGLAFSLEERQLLGIHGLLPPRIKTEDEQVEHCKALMKRFEAPLDKFIYLRGLARRNQRLFYRLISSDVKNMLPLVYSPTIGIACLNYSYIYTDHEGLFITINDKGHVYEVVKNWPERDVRAVCVTDGERILGYGDLGANGMGIAIGKLSLYTALAGIKPNYLLPICLDVGTNNENLLSDNVYIGLKQKRVQDKEYEDFLDEFVHAVTRRFGKNCLIHFENFGNSNAFLLLEKYQKKFCVMNDDIQGTGAVVVAAILASLKIKNNNLEDDTVLFYGAGEACLGAADLCAYAMTENGLLEEEAKSRIWLMDTKGLLIKDRPTGGLTTQKLKYVQDHYPIEKLEEAIDVIKPTILVGACSVRGAFSPRILKKMSEVTEKPIIIALSNPISKTECTAQEAYSHTEGTCIFASSLPFEPLQFNGKMYYTSQCNNAYIFPGVALGVIACQMKYIPKAVFLIAAEKLAEMVPDDQLITGCLFPPFSIINLCCIHIAMTVMQYAYKHNLALFKPEPDDKFAFIVSEMYDLHYPRVFPLLYKW